MSTHTRQIVCSIDLDQSRDLASVNQGCPIMGATAAELQAICTEAPLILARGQGETEVHRADI